MKEMKDEFKMKILYLCCRKSDRGHWGEAGGAPQELPGARPQQVQQVRLLFLLLWAAQYLYFNQSGNIFNKFLLDSFI